MNKQVEAFLMCGTLGPEHPADTINKSKFEDCSEKRTLPISCITSIGRLRMSMALRDGGRKRELRILVP